MIRDNAPSQEAPPPRLHRERPKPWDHGMLRLPIPLGSGRRAYLLAPADGLSLEECARVAGVVGQWHHVDPADAQEAGSDDVG